MTRDLDSESTTPGSNALQELTALPQDTEFRRALDADMEKLCQQGGEIVGLERYSSLKRYLQALLDINNQIFTSRRGMDWALNEAREKILLMSRLNWYLEDLEVITYVVKFLDRLRKTLVAAHTNGKRTIASAPVFPENEPNESPRLNKEIIAIFQEATSFSGLIATLQEFIPKNRSILSRVNLSTVLYNFKKIVLIRENVQSRSSGNEYIIVSPPERALLKNFLEIMATEIDNSDGYFDVRNIANAMYGLFGLDDTVFPESMLHVMTKKIRILPYNITRGLDISNILYGLQGLAKSEAVLEFLQAFSDKVQIESSVIQEQNICMSLEGLWNHREFPEAQLLIDQLFHGLVGYREMNHETIRYLVKMHALYGRRLPPWLEKQYRAFQAEEQPAAAGSEQFMYMACKQAGLLVVHNVSLDGFEMDLYFPELSCNIELDGPQHLLEPQHRQDLLRDEYLKRKGIVIIRFDLSGPWSKRNLQAIAHVISRTVRTKKFKNQHEWLRAEIRRILPRADLLLEAISQMNSEDLSQRLLALDQPDDVVPGDGQDQQHEQGEPDPVDGGLYPRVWPPPENELEQHEEEPAAVEGGEGHDVQHAKAN